MGETLKLNVSELKFYRNLNQETLFTKFKKESITLECYYNIFITNLFVMVVRKYVKFN